MNAYILGVNPMPDAGVLVSDFNNGTVQIFEPPTGTQGELLYRTSPTSRVYTALALNKDLVFVIESRDVSRQVGAYINNERVYSVLSLRRLSDNSWRVQFSVEYFRKAHEQGHSSVLLQLGGYIAVLLCGVCNSARLTAVSFKESGFLKKLTHVDFDSNLLDFATFKYQNESLVVAGLADRTLRLFALTQEPAELALIERFCIPCPTPFSILVLGDLILVADAQQTTMEQKLWLWRAKPTSNGSQLLELEVQKEIRILSNELAIGCWCAYRDYILVFNLMARELQICRYVASRAYPRKI